MHQMYGNAQMQMQMQNNPNNMNMYGMGFQQRQPNIAMQNQNFFVPGMMQNFSPNRQM